ncbi:4Fe-4S binding protein [uncultured Draconibacterium sp.]|uniref:4Fe-4S binding protein n=1 Tax=uncultured Draconibacterium sp. TaxID=1573823 RepID=UPI0025F270C3|nr:4Fe-4S binding protein [uncultured Draconibacterium sp.]
MVVLKKKYLNSILAPFFLFFVVAMAAPALSVANQQNQDVFETFTDDYNPNEPSSKCSGCSDAESCQTGEGTTAPPWLKYSLLALLAVGGAVYISKKFNWKLAVLLLVLLTLGFIPKRETCSSESCNADNKLIAKAAILPNTQEDEFAPLEQTEKEDEFETFSDNDEFEAFDDTNEFEAFDESTEFETLDDSTVDENETYSIYTDRNFTLSVLVLALTLLAGILVRFKTTRKLKTIMLLSTMIYLGFINGACPCMISSFQNTVMYVMGLEVRPVHMIWFIGLIPLTYFFGKVWCGWVCHLGALQEFIFRPGVLTILQNRKSQNVLRWIRLVVLLILVVQIIITKTNIFIHYDPFKVAFNLFSANTLGYVLLVIMLLSSVLIYRPFCRAFCPVGLILGWINYLPGAAKLNKTESCVDCKTCSNACRHNALTYESKKSYLNHEDCILCGDCIDTCRFTSLEIKGIAK